MNLEGSAGFSLAVSLVAPSLQQVQDPGGAISLLVSTHLVWSELLLDFCYVP